MPGLTHETIKEIITNGLIELGYNTQKEAHLPDGGFADIFLHDNNEPLEIEVISSNVPTRLLYVKVKGQIQPLDPIEKQKRREKLRLYDRQYYQRHRERCLSTDRAYRKLHPEKYKAHYQKYREKYLAYATAYRQKNREKCLARVKACREKKKAHILIK